MILKYIIAKLNSNFNSTTTSTWVDLALILFQSTPHPPTHPPTGLVVVSFNFNSKFNSINYNF